MDQWAGWTQRKWSCGHVIAKRVGQVVRIRKTVRQPNRNDVKL